MGSDNQDSQFIYVSRLAMAITTMMIRRPGEYRFGEIYSALAPAGAKAGDVSRAVSSLLIADAVDLVKSDVKRNGSFEVRYRIKDEDRARKIADGEFEW